MDALDNSYTDYPILDWYKTMKDILNIFQKESLFGLDDYYYFWEYCFTQVSCVKV